jgi:hypothetical protein
MVRTERPSRCATLAAGSSEVTGGCLEGSAGRVSSSEKLGRHGGDLRDLACHEAPITPPRAKIMRHKSRFVAHDVRDLLCTLDIALRTQDIAEGIPGPNFGYVFLTQFNFDRCQCLRDDRTR